MNTSILWIPVPVLLYTVPYWTIILYIYVYFLPKPLYLRISFTYYLYIYRYLYPSSDELAAGRVELYVRQFTVCMYIIWCIHMYVQWNGWTCRNPAELVYLALLTDQRLMRGHVSFIGWILSEIDPTRGSILVKN